MTAGTPRPLERAMRLPGVLFLVLSAATPASSFFVIVPDVLASAGTGAVWAMLGAAVIAGGVAQIYAELASAFPYAGGEYAMTARVLGPAIGFAMLAVNLLNLLLATAVLSLGVARELAAVWPAAPTLPVALACLALATGLGVLNIRTNAWITGAFLAVELAALAFVVALGVAHPVRGLETFAAPMRLEGAALVPAGWAAAALAATTALFAYDGYGSAAYFAEELRDPRRRVARAVTWALALVVGFELLPLLAVLAGAPDLRALFGRGMGAFVEARAGPAASRALGAAVALAILNAVIALNLLSARQVYAAARDGAWPAAASRALIAIHPRFRSPWIATLAAGAAAAGLCLLPLRLLLGLTGTGLAAIYAALCVTLVVGRRTGATASAAHRMPGAPWTPALVFTALATIVLQGAWEGRDGRISLVATTAVATLGAFWSVAATRGGRWRPTAPPDDAADDPAA